ncbi:MAG TPA: 5'-nucleotidase C-terminal domain-containing protein [Draconibacterium sp.]|nr:5'-nucleotidase C-terminal domain-containing protein [Draconibacterium sp.]
MRQSFSRALLITWIFFLFSCQHDVVKTAYETENISVSSQEAPLDSSIIKLYSPYKEIIDKDMNRVISISDTDMDKDRPESLLTNFLGDLLLQEGAREAQLQNLNLVPSISFYNYGGIRSTIPKGEITVGKIFELMPFENELVFLELSGDNTLAFLNYVANHGGGSIGGARFTIKDGKAGNIKIGGKPFDPQQSYWIVTNDYVAAGGDGLAVFQDRINFINSGELIRDIIIRNLEEHQKNNEHLSAKLDGRIHNE